ncbi:SAM-dependent methyltransferase [Saccharobesus litoralis]|uniref:tRNA 5-carboxymethoxyuridine methyltransferase n=1 Tax=Saccharobesus litoralis TaxID=2172099 RepID=A0A2S0VLJ8_9ALTE|nr:methyltransferase domain-containing protein [Saccharobesus litoralis]AWB64990.1 SAM-dependent methyltransferase [Saccharobesus litoralis]
MQDYSFDHIVDKFSNNIYQATKGKLRLAILQDDLESFQLAACREDPEQHQALSILDAGAGTGEMALWLAQLGHNVHAIDVSSEMVKTIEQRAQLHEITRLTSQACAIQEYAQNANNPQFDWIICHAVLEWTQQPQDIINTLYSLLKPGGKLSLMFFNHTAKLIGNLIYGNFDYVAKGLKTKKEVKLNPKTQLEPELVYSWLQACGFNVLHKRGVRTFHDYLRNIEQQQTDFASILRFEKQFSKQEPFISMAKYIHVVCEK